MNELLNLSEDRANVRGARRRYLGLSLKACADILEWVYGCARSGCTQGSANETPTRENSRVCPYGARPRLT